ncbi:MAG: SRPBCC family protein [Proteobacteria bacterium]|nr:SRPBCC family protein [Pseudomonadota bacterium]
MNKIIEKSVEIKASIEMVWQAVNNYRHFNQWFRVRFKEPFAEGKTSIGAFSYPGYESLNIELTPVKIDPLKYFSFHWHPYAVNPEIDYSNETCTLVEFILEESPTAVRLSFKESGFEKLPKARQDEAFKMNEEGWDEQIKNIANYLKPL